MSDHPRNPSSDSPSENDSETSTLTEDRENDQEAALEPSTPIIPPMPPPGDGSDQDETPDDDGGRDLSARMTFLEHLDELRKRILHSVVGIVVAFCICWTLREEIFHFLAVPIADVVGGVDKLIFIKPTEPFSIWLKVSFVASIFLTSPFLLLQVWLFIAPGLYRKEKNYAIPFLVSSTALFVFGGAFAYYVILPIALDFLINEFGALFTPMVSAIEYFNFEVLILVGMGAIFQLPVLVAFLSLFGLVTPGFLWKNFRYAFLLIIIVAAIVSPTADALNLFLWSGPMVALYLISIVVSWVFKRRRDRAMD